MSTNHFFTVGLTAAFAALFAVCWLGWQLLRQNGRLLLRLEAVEKRLDALEFGGAEEPAGLAVHMAAPEFELPDLTGQAKSLAQLRGQPLLLIFFNPACGFCRELAPKLAAVAAGFQPAVEGGILPPGNTSQPPESRDSSVLVPPETHSAELEARLKGRQGRVAPLVLIISTGSVEANRQLFGEHKVTFPVLLQEDAEVATAYKANGTPSGYLISAEGKIASELAMGGEALLALAGGKSEIRNQKSEMDQSLVSSAATTEKDARFNRFSNHSLARSRIKRDGLKAGTPAPTFRLPRVDGGDELSLEDVRGRQVLLVFSSPHCGPCNTLAPELEKFHHAQQKDDFAHADTAAGNGQSRTAVQVLMISKGDPTENRAKIKEHHLTFPVVLQQQWEISSLYAMFATPVAYLIDETGTIAAGVAVGTDAILEVIAKTNPARPTLARL